MATFVQVGALIGSANALTVNAPVGRTVGNFLVLNFMTEAQAPANNPPSGWLEFPGSPQSTGSPGVAGAIRLSRFYRRADGTAADNAVMGDSGATNIGIIEEYADVPNDASDPWDLSYGGVDATVDTNVSVSGGTTTLTDLLAAIAVAHSIDGTNTNFPSSPGWQNADLANLTERFDDTASAGLGAGIGIVTGEKATIGAFGATTVTMTLASAKAWHVVVLRSATSTGGGGAFTLTADAGSFALTGTAASLEFGRTVAANAGSYALTGQPATFIVTVDADAGSVTVTGQPATLVMGRRLVADAGAFALTGQAASLLAGRVLGATAGAYTLAGQDATLTYSAGGLTHYSLSAESGTVAVSGQTATLRVARTVAAAPGSFALTGTDATLRATRVLSGETGAYTLTGEAAGLRLGQTMVAESGTVVLSGSDVQLGATRLLAGEAGAFAFAGTAASLLWSGANLAVPLPGPTVTRAVGSSPRTSQIGGIPKTRKVSGSHSSSEA